MNIRQHVRRIGFVMGGVVLTGSILGAQLVNAATYYVATTGNDSNPGTEASPFRTINRGVKALKPSDTLYVNSGTYNESLINPLPSGLSASQPTTITGPTGANRPVLRPTSGNSYIILLNQNRSNIRFKNLVIDGRAYSGTLNAALATNGDFTITGLTLEDCELIGRTGVGPTASAVVIAVNTKATVRRCSIHGWRNSGNPAAHGLYWRGSNGLIEQNEIYDNNGYGLQFYGTSNMVHNNIFRSNYVHDNDASAIYCCRGNNNKIYNNIMVKNSTSGIWFNAGSDNHLYNNTIYNNSVAGIWLTGGSGSIGNNIVYQNGANIKQQVGTFSLFSNLTTDPKFVNAAGANFSLQSFSPAIDKGVTLSMVPTDFAGKSRPQGSAYDIGAYEYGGTTNTAVSAPTNLMIIDAN